MVYNLSVKDKLSKSNKISEKRLGKGEVRKLLSQILNKGGDIEFTFYAEKRMQERGITAPTVINVLQRGKVFDGEEYTHEGFVQWRYRVETTRYRIVVTFQVETQVIVINAIDFKSHLKKGEE